MHCVDVLRVTKYISVYRRKKLTVTNVSICLMILAGAVFVAQPTFITSQATVTSSPPAQNGTRMSDYTKGALITISATFACSTSNVLQSHFTDIPSPYFMLIGGVWSLVVGPLFCLYLGQGDPRAVVEGFMAAPAPLMLVASFSVTAGLLVLLALRVTGDPVMISVVRSTEIVMGLGLDIILSAIGNYVGSEALDFKSMSFAFKVLGSAMVTLGAIIMPFADKIQEKSAKKLQECLRTEDC